MLFFNTQQKNKRTVIKKKNSNIKNEEYIYFRNIITSSRVVTALIYQIFLIQIESFDRISWNMFVLVANNSKMFQKLTIMKVYLTCSLLVPLLAPSQVWWNLNLWHDYSMFGWLYHFELNCCFLFISNESKVWHWQYP